METSTLDHVALRVADRSATTLELLERLDVHVIEHTDRFTLIGADADHGKLTLLDAIAGEHPVPGRLGSLVLAETRGVAPPPPLVLGCGLVITFAALDELGAEWIDTPRHALVGLTLCVVDPPIAAAHLEFDHQMHVCAVTPEHAVVDVGDGVAAGRITLMREAWGDRGAAEMLDHVGIRVPDVRHRRAQIEAAGLDVERWVEAPHSLAAFVAGPEQLLLEFVELTAPLELA